jgi:Cu(I)/Ag(I) efflux system protein CusF
MKIVVVAAASLAVASLATSAFAQHAGHEHGEAAAAPSSAPQGTGVVKALDAKSGSITIHHGPITALGWPAMTMTFKASPEVLKAAKAGQTVTFTLNAAGDEVVAIQ